MRLNRLFESDGEAGIARFAAEAARYGRDGMEVEIQVRYHPSQAENGNLAAWTRYVRRVVDVLGRVHGVVAMTITNEVNLAISPNTSDGFYQHAQDALITGIEAARAQALRDHLPRLRFGFTYAYRFSPSGDASFFSYLRSHGGTRFIRALGFVGVDFYPGSFYPPVILPGEGYRSVLAQAAGTVRNCLAPLAGIPAARSAVVHRDRGAGRPALRGGPGGGARRARPGGPGVLPYVQHHRPAVVQPARFGARGPGGPRRAAVRHRRAAPL